MKRISIIGAVALVVTLVWACSSAVEDLILTPDASAGGTVSTSGERLQIRPIVYEGDDGSIIHMGEEIFDTELGVVCEPGLAADGVIRCLPKGASVTFDLLAFASEDCGYDDRAVVMTPNRCGHDYFVAVEHSEECHTEESIRLRIFEPRDTLASIFGEECEGPISTEGWNYGARRLAEVSPESFVRIAQK